MLEGKKTIITAGLTILVGIAGIAGIYIKPDIAEQVTIIGLAVAQIFMRFGIKNGKSS